VTTTGPKDGLLPSVLTADFDPVTATVPASGALRCVMPRAGKSICHMRAASRTIPAEHCVLIMSIEAPPLVIHDTHARVVCSRLTKPRFTLQAIFSSLWHKVLEVRIPDASGDVSGIQIGGVMIRSVVANVGRDVAGPTCCAALLMALAVAGCSSSGGSSTAKSESSSGAVGSSQPPRSTSAPADVKLDAATRGAIAHAFDFFFATKTTPATAARVLQHGAVFKATLAAQDKNPLGQNLTATVSAVVLQSANVANVSFSLLSGGKVLLPDTPGTAVKENGTWTVAAETFCALLKLQGAAPKACDDTSITALPS
jgi:hypothetical protein